MEGAYGSGDCGIGRRGDSFDGVRLGRLGWAALVEEILWRWNVTKDDWEWQTQASPEMKRKVLARYKRHDARGVRFKWTDGYKPKKFRAREKKDA